MDLIRKSFLLITLLLLPLVVFSQENSPTSCGDGIDNDGDGLIDCLDPDCSNLPNNGCSTCTDGISFADTLIEYLPGCSLADPDPEGALGVSDYTGVSVDEPQFVFLGQGGSLKLGFTNNLLTNSGTNAADVWIFEVGPAVEACRIAIRPANNFTESQLQTAGIPDADNNGFYEIGMIAGATSSLDIDGVVPGFAAGQLQFNAIEITDVIDGACAGGTPGADIDAVCALSSAPPIDCAGTPNGLAQVDECGRCLERNNPEFNSCLDCAGEANGTAVTDGCGRCLEPNDPDFDDCRDCSGTLNGSAVVDACGLCLEPTDPGFNACLDCAGEANGNAIRDSCGVCLEPDDVTFNACLDCAGTPDGDAVIDGCGECLKPTSARFNQSCAGDNIIYVPNSFSPNGDGINDRFRVYKSPNLEVTLNKYLIFNKWGDLVYQLNETSFDSNTRWWDGTFRGRKLGSGVHVYLIEVEFPNTEVKVYRGNIMLVN